MDTFILAQTVSVNENPLGLVLTIGIFALVIGFIIYANIQTRKRRAAFREYAETLGWQFNEESAWQHAKGANFKIVYSYDGVSDGIPWAMIYSLKTQKSAGLSMDGSSVSRKNQRSDRFDWRSEAVSVPNMVLLKFKAPHQIMNQMLSMFGVDGNTYAQYVLDLGISQAEEQIRLQMPLVISLLTKQNPIALHQNDYGLKLIEDFQAEQFELYAQSLDSAQTVLNDAALDAINAWQDYFQAKFPNNTQGYFMYQPMILFSELGIYMVMDAEPREIDMLDALVKLGAALVRSQR